jgi:hypothetical protein
MTYRKISRLLALIGVLYLLFPFFAGLLAIGDRDGPKIYSSSYHTLLYMISYEMVQDEKPRQYLFLERPWFYGFPRKRLDIKNDPSNSGSVRPSVFDQPAKPRPY